MNEKPTRLVIYAEKYSKEKGGFIGETHVILAESKGKARRMARQLKIALHEQGYINISGG